MMSAAFCPSGFIVKQACPGWDQKNNIVLVISIISNEVTGSNGNTCSFNSETFVKWLLCEESSHYLQIPKFLWGPRINIPAFAVIHGHVYTQSSRKSDSPRVHTPSWGPRRQQSAFLFQFSCCEHVPSAVYIMSAFSRCCFLFVSWCLKWPPSIVLKCYVLSLIKPRKVVMCLTEKIQMLTPASFRQELECCWQRSQW